MVKKSKNVLVILILFILSIKVSFAQTEYIKVPQLGSIAPSFYVLLEGETKKFPEDYKGKWKILFSTPSCFTPVCTSEMKELLKEYGSFKDKNCEIFALTFFGIQDEKKWISQIKEEIKAENEFVLIPDIDKSIAKLYGMYHPKMSEEKPMRTVFFIDPESKIRAILIYPMLNGRNIVEIKRILSSMQFSDKEHTFTIANWDVK